MKINLPTFPSTNSLDCISEASLAWAAYHALDLWCCERGLDKVAHQVMPTLNAFDDEKLASILVRECKEVYGESSIRWFKHFLNRELNENVDYYAKKEDANFFVDLDLMDAILKAFMNASNAVQVPVFS